MRIPSVPNGSHLRSCIMYAITFPLDRHKELGPVCFYNKMPHCLNVTIVIMPLKK